MNKLNTNACLTYDDLMALAKSAEQKQKVTLSLPICDAVRLAVEYGEINKLRLLIERTGAPVPNFLFKESEKRRLLLNDPEHRAIAGFCFYSIDAWNQWRDEHIAEHPQCAKTLITFERHFAEDVFFDVEGTCAIDRKLVSPWTLDYSEMTCGIPLNKWLYELHAKSEEVKPRRFEDREVDRFKAVFGEEEGYRLWYEKHYGKLEQ